MYVNKIIKFSNNLLSSQICWYIYKQAKYLQTSEAFRAKSVVNHSGGLLNDLLFCSNFFSRHAKYALFNLLRFAASDNNESNVTSSGNGPVLETRCRFRYLKNIRRRFRY